MITENETDDNLDLFQGKWKWYDERAALFAREALQEAVNNASWKNGDNATEVSIKLTVMVSVKPTDNSSMTVNRIISELGMGEGDDDELRRAIDSCLDSRIILPKSLERGVAFTSKLISGTIKNLLGISDE